MLEFLQISNNTLFVYYFLSNVVYLVLLILAVITNASHQRRLGSIRLERLKQSPFIPPVAILAPAHNEAGTIRGAVRSLLSLDYPDYEVIVVNDGSTDGTLGELMRGFHLIETDMLHVSQVQSKPVRGVYMSATEPRLRVIGTSSARRRSAAGAWPLRGDRIRWLKHGARA